jgi:Ca2+ transporting ATPase
MKDENNLVRYLQACETMGGANNICSDKTGTLTKNLMTVVKIFIEQGMSMIPLKLILPENTLSEYFAFQFVIILQQVQQSARQGTEITNNQVGNKTECALLEMAFRMGYDYKKFRNKDNQSRIFPFSSEKKKMATCFSDEKGINYVFVKGAPDFLLEHCTKFINKSGNVSKINSDFIASIKETIENFASESLRTILLTYKEVSETPESWDDIENDLIIIGMVGIKDPLREGIKKAVEACHTEPVLE